MAEYTAMICDMTVIRANMMGADIIPREIIIGIFKFVLFNVTTFCKNYMCVKLNHCLYNSCGVIYITCSKIFLTNDSNDSNCSNDSNDSNNIMFILFLGDNKISAIEALCTSGFRVFTACDDILVRISNDYYSKIDHQWLDDHDITL